MPAKDKKAERKARYDSQPERERELSLAYYRANRESINKAKRAAYPHNREAEIAKVKAWQTANPLAFRMGQKAQGANRRAKALGMEERITRADVMAVFEQAGWNCAACGHRLNLSGNLDHVVPMGLGGRNHRSNLQPLCESPCHDTKSIKDRTAIKDADISVTDPA